MGFFDFSKKNISNLSESIKSRWIFHTNGLISDSKRNNNLVWKIDINSFENFLAGLERRSGQSLGRRLAHSSSESEEWLILDSKIKSNASFIEILNRVIEGSVIVIFAFFFICSINLGITEPLLPKTFP